MNGKPFVAQYGVLSHYPAPNRTEHVNIGIVVFLPHGEVRVHLGQDLKKLRAIDPQTNLETARSWEQSLPLMLQGKSTEEAVRFLSNFGQWSLSSQLGRFSYRDDSDYLHRVQMALHSLVSTPPRPGRERGDMSRLHMDLKNTFLAKGWLGKNIGNHEIVERHPLGPMTTAEFALRNGVLHVIESLDLRSNNLSAKRNDARSKALTLDMAKRHEATASRYCVVAGIDSPLINDAKGLLGQYSDEVYTWESVTEMNALMERLGRATGKPGMNIPFPSYHG